MISKKEPSDFVESVITSMVESDLDVGTAVSSVLDGDVEDQVIEYSESELDEGITCPSCGSDNLDYIHIESDGEEIPAIHCQDCDTGLVLELGESDEDDEEDEVYEAEIDEDNPVCPVCGSTHLEGRFAEDEDGEEMAFIECQDCNSSFFPVEQEEDN